MDFHNRWIFSLVEKDHICECVFRLSLAESVESHEATHEYGCEKYRG